MMIPKHKEEKCIHPIKKVFGHMYLETTLTDFISHTCSQPGLTDNPSATCSEDHTHLPNSAFAASQVSSQLTDF